MKKYWQNIIEKREQYKRKRNSNNDNDKENEQPLSKRSKSKLSYSQWNFKTGYQPIRNEASRSLYVSLYLVAISNLLQNRFIICPEKTISGPNGHGPLDYALVSSTRSKVIGAIEVKATDYLRLAFNFLNVR
ncbi:hypothetical protein F8M41_021166 [Gigaspora margarita]|uniref:Uncharacterized protein n=1 Tax=Gigaspora margarita TaxID=4874 RepID=A0A8H4AHA4_GIGMA|nr:hypothetical protein F8M41_021166 [Gigaspora margarita]